MPSQRKMDHARAFASVLASENQIMEKRLAGMKSKGDDSVQNIHSFLQNITQVAKDTTIIINKLTPRENQKFTFDLQIVEDYFKFLQFSQLLERRDVIIHDIQVCPYDAGRTPPVHAISFSLTPRNDAEPMTGKRLNRLKEIVDAPDKRNPFQRFVSVGQVVRKEIDLTWIYKLSGIGSVGGVRIATIDSREYEAGTQFADMTITGIDADRVNLFKHTPNGDEKYIIRFRRK